MPIQPEPWLRGPIPEIDSVLAPVFYSFQQAREDLEQCTLSLTREQLRARPNGLGSVAFHLLHIAGSTDRLMTYLQGRELSVEQFDRLAMEENSGEFDREELLAIVDKAFRQAEAVVRRLDVSSLGEARTVGRLHFPTTVAGLLTHIAEHTQRHVGQAICVARFVG